jgi:hypothetical protein
MAARPDLAVPRTLRLLRPGEAARPPAEELPDDFYELTEADLHGFSIGAGAGGGKPAELQTAAMRELSRLKKQKEYTHAIVRVRLPGARSAVRSAVPAPCRLRRLLCAAAELVLTPPRVAPHTGGVLVQAAYHPQEPVAHVLELVVSCLEERLQAHPGAYLFTTPPRTTLDAAHSLVEAGLVPAATAILAWATPLPGPLAALGAEQILSEHARTLLAEATPDAAAALTSNFPSAKMDAEGATRHGGPSRASAVDAPGKGWISVTGDGSSSSEDASARGGSSAGGKAASGKPKWFNR